MKAAFVRPAVWDERTLDRGRGVALERFVEHRLGQKAYAKTFEAVLPKVQRLFDATSGLRQFTGRVLEAEPDLVGAARFLAGPPVSEDDLDTLVGSRVGKRLAPQVAERVAKVIQTVWDPVRFPWLSEKRAAKRPEIAAAVRWTAGLWAVERVRTDQRNESSRTQEASVADALVRFGYRQAARPKSREIRSLDELEKGTFLRETSLAGTKCDAPVRLRDGRLLALECKVSNTAVNSVKRLLRETGGKANAWRAAFGTQVITGAVLAGVYKLANLVEAQAQFGILVLWEHDLQPLGKFLTEVDRSAKT